MCIPEIILLAAPTRTESGAATPNAPFVAFSLDSNAGEPPIQPQEPVAIAGDTAAQVVSLAPTEPEGSIPGSIA